MESFSPLLLLLLLYLIIGVLGKSKKAKNQNAKPAEPVRRPAPAAPKKPAAPEPVSYTEAANRSAHRGADGTLHPTEHRHAAPSAEPFEGVTMEGVDPCHDYMLDDPALPVCADTQEEERAVPKVALPLSFTRDSVVNAVVMSEVLGRRHSRGNRKAQY